DGIRDKLVTGVQTCALPISSTAALGTAGTNTTLTASDASGACSAPPSAESHCWWGSAIGGAPNTTRAIPGFSTAVNGVSATNTLDRKSGRVGKGGRWRGVRR